MHQHLEVKLEEAASKKTKVTIIDNKKTKTSGIDRVLGKYNM